ncbi:CRISPR-associated Cas2 family protein [Fluviicoccus keumensis]|uniref:CRISPR-associated endoribonuclease Cas2 n=1 Tax=Fluviicoccus keumensis TaxID=1435465 RepID=A0A4Q7YNH8_9GAMM|nr:CRISPR-associated endonuclease Cas2 [Fluviicoccus keumensis]RZU38229.1 CRISPR-associated Cas2 family protein [Fluviicoccus keumensis]
MMVLVTYDVSLQDEAGARRLRRIAKICRDYGQRVQFSVFEIEVDPAQWVMIRNKLVGEMRLETDSLRFYFMGSNWERRVEHVGAKPALDLKGPLIF